VLVEPIVRCASLLADRAPLGGLTPHRLVTYDHESRRGCFRRGRYRCRTGGSLRFRERLLELHAIGEARGQVGRFVG
jgi:hypothetical protein